MNLRLINTPKELLLHEAVIYVLQEEGKAMTIEQITDRINQLQLYSHPDTGFPAIYTEVLKRVSGNAYKDSLFIHQNNLIKYNAIADTRLMRLTWNEMGWVQPTGHKWNRTKQGTNAAFENQYGFGFEEWLLNPAFFFDGYQYGFIRGAEDLKNRHTIVKEVYLFTIHQQSGERFLVGKIKNLELISTYSPIKKTAKALFNRNSKFMCDHLVGVEADLDGFQWFDYPSVRFKLEDAQIFPRLQNIEGLDSGKYNRFIPYKVEGDLLTFLKNSVPADLFNFNEGEAETSGRYQRTTSAATTTVNRLHDQMLKDLKAYLASRKAYDLLSIDKTWFGNNKADVVAKHGDKSYSIFEVKTSSNIRRNIREALGQLVDYACWYDNIKIKQLIIVSPEPLVGEEHAYFKRVKSQFATPVAYWYYDREKLKIYEVC